MPTTEEDALRIARVLTARFRNALRANKNLSQHELFDIAYLEAFCSDTPAKGYLRARGAVLEHLAANRKTQTDKRHVSQKRCEHSQNELRLDVEEALQLFTEFEQLLCYLRFASGLTQEETARALSASVYLVRSCESGLMGRLSKLLKAWEE